MKRGLLKGNSIISIFMLLLMMLFLFSGCVKANYTVDIKKDGGKIVTEETVTKQVFEELLSLGYTPEDFTADGGELVFYEEGEIEYVKLIEEKKFESLEDLVSYIQSLKLSADPGSESDKRIFKEFEVLINEEDKLVCKGTVDRVERNETLGTMDTDYYTEFKMTFKFPGEVLELYNVYNVGLKTGEKTVEFDLKEMWETNAAISFEIVSESDSKVALFEDLDISIIEDLEGNSFSITIMVILLILLVVLIVVVIVLLLLLRNKRKKLKKEDEDLL